MCSCLIRQAGYSAYVAKRAEAEVRLIKQTRTEGRSADKHRCRQSVACRAGDSKAFHQGCHQSTLMERSAPSSSARNRLPALVNQMFLMLFCLHKNFVISAHPYASLTLPTSRSCMTQSDLLTEKRHAICIRCSCNTFILVTNQAINQSVVPVML